MIRFFLFDFAKYLLKLNIHIYYRKYLLKLSMKESFKGSGVTVTGFMSLASAGRLCDL